MTSRPRPTAHIRPPQYPQPRSDHDYTSLANDLRSRPTSATQAIGLTALLSLPSHIGTYATFDSGTNRETYFEPNRELRQRPGRPDPERPHGPAARARG